MKKKLAKNVDYESAGLDLDLHDLAQLKQLFHQNVKKSAINKQIKGPSLNNNEISNV